MFASQFTSALYTASGPVVVGLLAGVAQAGAYAALERIVNPIISVGLLTHVAAYPRLAALYRSDRRNYLALMRVVLLAYAAFSVALVAGVAAAWEPVLRFIFGEGAQQHAALLAAGLLWVIFGIFGTALTGYLTVSGQGRAVLPLTLRVLALSLLIGIPGVWACGAWAWMLSLCAAQALVIACGWRAWRDESRARILAVT